MREEGADVGDLVERADERDDLVGPDDHDAAGLRVDAEVLVDLAAVARRDRRRVVGVQLVVACERKKRVSSSSAARSQREVDEQREPYGFFGGHRTSGKALGSTEVRGFEMTVRTSMTESRSWSSGVKVRSSPAGESR